MIYKDHLGNEFKTKTDMCNYWHIDISTYTQRINKGWDVGKALTYRAGDSERTDHLGTLFASVEAMCEHWGIDSDEYLWRRDRGWNIEQALTLKEGAKPIKDHLGNGFKSERAMCEHWGSDVNIFVALGKSNPDLSLKSRLELSKNSKAKKEVTDHLGNKFKSLTAMCSYHNISLGIYKARIARGLSVEKALTGVKMIRGMAIDPFGNKFNSVKDMCKAYNISVGTFRARLRNGWDTEEALVVPVKK